MIEQRRITASNFEVRQPPMCWRTTKNQGNSPKIESFWNLLFCFVQAEDGIRDLTVTGVQTCALPISLRVRGHAAARLVGSGRAKRPRAQGRVRICPLVGRGGDRATRYRQEGVRSLQPGQRKRSEEHTSELQSQSNLVCRLLLEQKNTQ